MRIPQFRQGRRARRAMIQRELASLSGESSRGSADFDRFSVAGVDGPELSPAIARSSSAIHIRTTGRGTPAAVAVPATRRRI